MRRMFHVTWEIDLEAENAEEAALKARKIQLDPQSAATVFIVSDGKDTERISIHFAISVHLFISIF